MSKEVNGISVLEFNQFANALGLFHVSISGAERMTRLQMEVTRKLSENNAQFAKELAAANDPKTLIELRARLAIQNAEQLSDCSKKFYEVAVESREQIMWLIKQQLAAVGDAGAAPASETRSDNPAPFFDAREMMAAADKVTGDLSELAKQAVLMAIQSFHSAAAADRQTT